MNRDAFGTKKILQTPERGGSGHGVDLRRRASKLARELAGTAACRSSADAIRKGLSSQAAIMTKLPQVNEEARNHQQRPLDFECTPNGEGVKYRLRNQTPAQPEAVD